MTKLLKTLNEKLEASDSTLNYHKDNCHYYKGRTDTLKEVLRLLKLESEGEQEWQVKKL